MSGRHAELFHNMTTILGKTNKPSPPSVSDFQQLPHIFGDLFKNKILSFQKSFSCVPQKEKIDYQLTFSGTPVFSFTPVSEQFLQKTIPNISVLDPIPTKLLYKTFEVLLPTVTNILNESFTSGTVPSEFKTAVVKPLLKKPSLDPNELKNYRSISHLPFLSKLLENVFFNNSSRICQHTICSAFISLLTGPGTAQRLFFSVYSTIFSLPLMRRTFRFSCFWIFLQLLIQ